MDIPYKRQKIIRKTHFANDLLKEISRKISQHYNDYEFLEKPEATEYYCKLNTMVVNSRRDKILVSKYKQKLVNIIQSYHGFERSFNCSQSLGFSTSCNITFDNNHSQTVSFNDQTVATPSGMLEDDESMVQSSQNITSKNISKPTTFSISPGSNLKKNNLRDDVLKNNQTVEISSEEELEILGPKPFVGKNTSACSSRSSFRKTCGTSRLNNNYSQENVFLNNCTVATPIGPVAYKETVTKEAKNIHSKNSSASTFGASSCSVSCDSKLNKNTRRIQLPRMLSNNEFNISTSQNIVHQNTCAGYSRSLSFSISCNSVCHNTRSQEHVSLNKSVVETPSEMEVVNDFIKEDENTFSKNVSTSFSGAWSPNRPCDLRQKENDSPQEVSVNNQTAEMPTEVLTDNEFVTPISRNIICKNPSASCFESPSSHTLSKNCLKNPILKKQTKKIPSRMLGNNQPVDQDSQNTQNIIPWIPTSSNPILKNNRTKEDISFGKCSKETRRELLTDNEFEISNSQNIISKNTPLNSSRSQSFSTSCNFTLTKDVSLENETIEIPSEMLTDKVFISQTSQNIISQNNFTTFFEPLKVSTSTNATLQNVFSQADVSLNKQTIEKASEISTNYDSLVPSSRNKIGKNAAGNINTCENDNENYSLDLFGSQNDIGSNIEFIEIDVQPHVKTNRSNRLENNKSNVGILASTGSNQLFASQQTIFDPVADAVKDDAAIFKKPFTKDFIESLPLVIVDEGWQQTIRGEVPQQTSINDKKNAKDSTETCISEFQLTETSQGNRSRAKRAETKTVNPDKSLNEIVEDFKYYAQDADDCFSKIITEIHKSVLEEENKKDDNYDVLRPFMSNESKSNISEIDEATNHLNKMILDEVYAKCKEMSDSDDSEDQSDEDDFANLDWRKLDLNN